MRRCFMVAGGAVSASLLKKIFREGDFAYVFAVDRGLEALDACGIRPTHLVGDFDSVTPEVLEKYLPRQGRNIGTECDDAKQKRAADAERNDVHPAGEPVTEGKTVHPAGEPVTEGKDAYPAGEPVTEGKTAYPADGEYPMLERLIPEKDDTDTEHAMRLAVSLHPDEIVLLGGFGTRFDHVLANVHALTIPLRAGIPACMEDDTNRVRLLAGKPECDVGGEPVRDAGSEPVHGPEKEPVNGNTQKGRCPEKSGEPARGPEKESVNGNTQNGRCLEKIGNGTNAARLRIKKRDAWGTYVSLLPLTTEVTGITLKGFKYPLTDGVFRIGETVSLGVSNELTAEEGIIQMKTGILAVIESTDGARET